MVTMGSAPKPIYKAEETSNSSLQSNAYSKTFDNPEARLTQDFILELLVNTAASKLCY